MAAPFFTISAVDHEQSMVELAMVVCLPVLRMQLACIFMIITVQVRKHEHHRPKAMRLSSAHKALLLCMVQLFHHCAVASCHSLLVVSAGIDCPVEPKGKIGL